jgi:hypothetical protein
MIRSLVRNLRRVVSLLPLDQRVAFLRAHIKKQVPAEGLTASAGAKAVVAVEASEEPLYYALFTSIAMALASRNGTRSDLLLVRSINGAIGRGIVAWIGRSQPCGWLIASQWARAYGGMVDGIAYRSQSFDRPLDDIADLFRARRLWRELRAGLDMASLTVDGILIGDLVIDSYLRVRPSPRFELHDPFVMRLLWQALRDLRRAREYFGRTRPAVFLTTYSTYIEHGVAVRAALAAGVHVRSFGNFITFGRQLEAHNSFHTPDTGAYRREFEALDAQDERIAAAQEQLSVRLAGGIDSATSYMKVSAYAGTESVVDEVRGAVVVFLHDFYDSPHVYDDLVFPDFWAWIAFTIATLGEAGIPFFLKPHPNQIALSGDALADLKRSHPEVRFLSSGVTNTQLAEAGIICGVTVYGTVAHELAYLGVPSIACARHPHYAFDFCRTALSVNEYRELLRSPSKLPLPREEMRRQALAFYYMHNIHGSEDQLDLRRQFIALWKASHGGEPSGRDLLLELRRLLALPGYRAFLDQLTLEVNGHAC